MWIAPGACDDLKEKWRKNRWGFPFFIFFGQGKKKWKPASCQSENDERGGEEAEEEEQLKQSDTQKKWRLRFSFARHSFSPLRARSLARFFPDVSHQVIQAYDDTSTWIIERQRRQVAAGSLNGFGRVLFSVSPLFRRQLRLGLCEGSTDYEKKRRTEEKKQPTRNIYLFMFVRARACAIFYSAIVICSNVDGWCRLLLIRLQSDYEIFRFSL